ncbi:hypothetical protein D3C86_1862420 [compost metagenome]
MLPDLLGEQRAEPEGEGDQTLGTEALPDDVQPLGVELLQVRVQVEEYRLAEGFDAQTVHVEEVLFVQLEHLPIAHRHVAVDVRAVLTGVAGEVNGLNGFEGVGLLLNEGVQLLGGTSEHPARSNAE